MRRTSRVALVLAAALLCIGGGTALAATGHSTGHGNALMRVGPGPTTAILAADGYRLELRLSPNKPAVVGTISLRLTRRGELVNGARVKATLTMLDMRMGSQSAMLPQAGPGRYARSTALLGMSGHWGVRLRVTPHRGAAFSVGVVDTIGS